MSPNPLCNLSKYTVNSNSVNFSSDKIQKQTRETIRVFYVQPQRQFGAKWPMHIVLII